MDPIADAKMELEDAAMEPKAPGMSFMDVVRRMIDHPYKTYTRDGWADGSEIHAGKHPRFEREGSRPVYIAYTFRGESVGLWQPCLDDFTANDWRESE